MVYTIGTGASPSFPSIGSGATPSFSTGNIGSGARPTFSAPRSTTTSSRPVAITLGTSHSSNHCRNSSCSSSDYGSVEASGSCQFIMCIICFLIFLGFALACIFDPDRSLGDLDSFFRN